MAARRSLQTSCSHQLTSCSYLQTSCSHQQTSSGNVPVERILWCLICSFRRRCCSSAWWLLPLPAGLASKLPEDRLAWRGDAPRKGPGGGCLDVPTPPQSSGLSFSATPACATGQREGTGKEKMEGRCENNT